MLGRKSLTEILRWLGTAILVLLVLVALLTFVAYWRSTNDCERTTRSAHPIRAILNCDYGVDHLELREIEKPVPNDNQLLVRVKAVSLNPVDGHTMRGSVLMRPMTGLRKPKETRVGVDYAGIVEAVGKSVTRFKPGDEVFGGKNGAYAEYICVLQDKAVVAKPGNVSFEQAAGVGVAGLTALQGLRDQGKIQAGQKVLINGASGGVGTFAVQIAKAYGAEVTAVCSTRNLDLVRNIGADHVIDYTKEDFTKTEQRYDLIFDLVGNHSYSERRRLLTPNGICVLGGIGGAGLHPETWGRIAGNFWAAFRSKFGQQKFVFYIAKFNQQDLNVLRELMQTGKLTPVIDRTYKLSEIIDAFRYLEQGHARGKIVATID